MRVLLFDPNSTIQSQSDRSVYWLRDFFMSCGCEVQYAASITHGATASVYTQSWDLIVVPYIKSLAGNYTTLQTCLARFTDTTIPVFVSQAYQPNLSSAVTGASAVAGSATNVVTTGLKNWSSRQSERCTFYGDFPTLAGMSGVTVHADDGTSCCMWSNTVSSHPVLWIGAQSHSTAATGTNKPIKPWLGAQWMIDKRGGSINKRYLQLWWDGYDDANFLSAYSGGHMDTIYNSALSHGVTEMWLAATWSGTAGVTNPTISTWLLARKEQSGGLFRCVQHLTDLVDGTTGGAGSICSSDGKLFDQFATALTTYQGHCNQLTSLGWKLGSDGYGAGYPNVQNGNACNNPTAKFLADRGVNGIRLITGTLYPNLPGTVETVKTRRFVSQNWNGIQTVTCASGDTYNAIANPAFAGQTANNSVLEALTNGGAIYWHGNGLVLFAPWCDEIHQIYSTCPDVVKSGPWESMVTNLKQGNGFLIVP